METAELLKQLEINYKLIYNDLDFATHAIDARLAAASRLNSSIPELHALPTRIRALSIAAEEIAADAAQVIRQRQKAEAALKVSLAENHEVMVGLYGRLGVAPDPDWMAIADDVSQLNPVAKGSGASADVDGAYQGPLGQATHVGVRADTTHLGASHVDEGRPKQFPETIFEEEFLAVEARTRGRAKLEDVREVYSKIRQDYEAKANHGRSKTRPKPVSKRDLDKAGLKVFGLTGDCVVNTLRSMGLVAVSKSGLTLATVQ